MITKAPLRHVQHKLSIRAPGPLSIYVTINHQGTTEPSARTVQVDHHQATWAPQYIQWVLTLRASQHTQCKLTKWAPGRFEKKKPGLDISNSATTAKFDKAAYLDRSPAFLYHIKCKYGWQFNSNIKMCNLGSQISRTDRETHPFQPVHTFTRHTLYFLRWPLRYSAHQGVPLYRINGRGAGIPSRVFRWVQTCPYRVTQS